jgi:hypothetical protein
MENTEEIKKEFKAFIIDVCANEFPVKGDGLERCIDKYLGLLTSVAKVEQLKELKL